MRAVDSEGGHARAHPGDAMLTIARVVHGRRARCGREEAQLVQRHVVERRKEDLAEAPVGEGVPDLAARTRRRPEGHLPTGAPHRRRPGASWCLHRTLSMESV